MIENMDEFIDPLLDNVLLRSIYKKGPQYFVKIGDTEINYN